MRLLHGKLTSWNDEKGFGFITPLSGGKQIFVHIKAFNNRYQRPQLNQQFSYSQSNDKRGRVCATDVTYIGKQSGGSKRAGKVLPAIIVGGLFFAALGVSELIINRSALIVAFYLVASLVTFSIYAIDKNAAKKGAWRIAEAHLHLLALIGGWPGAMVAQQTLRHKSKKQEFRFVFWVTVILNCTGSIWLLTPQGTILIDSVIKALLQNLN